MPAPPRFARRGQPAEFSKRFGIPRGKPATAFDEALDAAKLHDSNGGLHIGHAKVVPYSVVTFDHHLVRLMTRKIRSVHRVLAKLLYPRRDLFIGGRDHPALARRQNLSGMKTEAGHETVRRSDAL